MPRRPGGGEPEHTTGEKWSEGTERRREEDGTPLRSRVSRTSRSGGPPPSAGPKRRRPPETPGAVPGRGRPPREARGPGGKKRCALLRSPRSFPYLRGG